MHMYCVDDLRRSLNNFDGVEDIILNVNDDRYIIVDSYNDGGVCRIKLISTMEYYGD